uniref:Uncharacterized protein n=1 Tax=uncultured marine microorganism HF4000_137B17 TaxID=455523 RepID=B3T286_9ZZZZ|nr:hypothetical protein ALOHA_HF4000137B17ctg1g32 [uncultured marine microorganism HF4000_137B17]
MKPPKSATQSGDRSACVNAIGLICPRVWRSTDSWGTNCNVGNVRPHPMRCSQAARRFTIDNV